jgi:hypothetical protein
MRHQGAVRLGWATWGVSAALILPIWLVAGKYRTLLPYSSDDSMAVLWGLAAGTLLLFCTPGALIVSRRPSNPIGWILWAIGLTFGLAVLLGEYAEYAYWVRRLPAAVPAFWASQLLGSGLYYGLVPLLFLLFPTGRLPSSRWRPIVWVLAAATAATLAGQFLRPGALDPRFVPDNPLGIPGAQHALDLSVEGGSVMLGVLALAAAVSLGLRYRRASGPERQQLKWFIYGAVVLLLTFVAFWPLVWTRSYGLVLIGFAGFTACVAIAILRHHLYDIDRLINRTLVYGLLTAVLGGVYAGLVLGLGLAFGGVGRHLPSWAVAGATLAVAAAFRPARRRIQAVVDRRFNRRKYDVTKTIEAFSARLRDEIDLDSLSNELLAVVHQTMEPTTVSLWLRPPAHGSRGALAVRSSPRPDPTGSGEPRIGAL